MKSALSFAAALLICVNGAFAHYRFHQLIVNGTVTPEYYYVRQNTNYNSPVTDVTSTDLRCNAGGLASGPATNVATVVAGSTVGFTVDTPIYHPGPLAVYMSKATGPVQSYDGSGPWFKISEVGATFTSNPAAINFPASNLPQYTFNIPASVRE